MNHNQTPLVSIIMPIYNSEGTLRQCIDSIVSQSYTNFELILVNDGSTDNTQNICDDFSKKDSRIKTIHKTNGGVSSARNIGIKNAAGRFITFCDSDDTVDNKWLSTFINNIDNSDVCIQGINCIFSNGTKETRTVHRHTGTDVIPLIPKLLNAKIFGYQQCKMYRKDLLLKHNIFFNTNIHFREDDIFFSNFLEIAQSFVCVDEAHYNYLFPANDKFYKDLSVSNVTNELCQSLLRICNGKPTPDICRFQIQALKSSAVVALINGEEVPSMTLKLYKSFVDRKDLGLPLKTKLVNWLIVNSPRFGYFSKTMIKFIHCFN